MSECGSLALVEQRLLLWRQQVADGLRSAEDSCRLFHGRGHYYPGLEALSIDYFSPALVVTLFAELKPDFETALLDKLEVFFDGAAIYLQRRYLPAPRYECVRGEVLERVFAQRGGLKFELSFAQQNIGFFLDIEPARHWLEQRAAGKSVLNLFAYTCTFSLVASAAGANSVLNMDLSSRSLNQGRYNYRLNELSQESVRFYANDILKSWSRLKRFGPYDVIVCDPPSFQKGSFVATKDYQKLLRRMNTLVADNGELLLCLNSPEYSYSEFRSLCEQHLQGFAFVERLQPSEDFPDVDEQRALKLLVYKRLV
ncbi:class I SAM-dependent methyltransferase [Agaribacterium haliotis]|uniref:class I SAM-dependent methyltransferase n=1 Tax=Agaribacterium haliotis TaxID=2013869 RepID=UPI000BB58CA3|nr:class I SAM-dependent methyltransferase [Agaribacterium haliotis]